MRISLSVIGVVLLLHAIWGKKYRWGLYDFVEDESDVVLDRRAGRFLEIAIGIALILGAVFYRASE